MAKFIPFDQRCKATVNTQAYYTGIAMRSSTRRTGCGRKAGANGYCWQHQDIGKAIEQAQRRIDSGKASP